MVGVFDKTGACSMMNTHTPAKEARKPSVVFLQLHSEYLEHSDKEHETRLFHSGYSGLT